MRRDRHKCVKRRVAGRAIVATTLVGPSFLIGGCRRSTVCQVGSCKDNDRRYWRATLLACRLTNGSIPARRRGTRWPEGGKGRMSLLLKVPDLVHRIPGHRPARSARRVRATCRRCAVPARRGPARMTDRTIGLRPRHDSSMVAMREGGERKCEVQSLSFFAFQVPSPIRGAAFAGPCWSGLACR
jgi:hypothetical protein